MAYIDGYLIPVQPGKLDAYRKMAEEMAPKFREWGATRVVEAVEDDCPVGKQNDFHTAVLSEDGEKTIFSWVEWPDKETRDAGWKKMEDYMETAEGPHDMPFDGKRMIYGGFSPIVDQ
ncbi:DUF1428 domain-containing protein [Sphingomicrobium clamense]|uniref:DUF1428 domain-containing protein n=1 Tax=Sphingomicrobium clamense TaxID=2851013 RepID=A0ABS6V3N4_9SPHN|nr:DUF1428 domain-containing protein [Sphingomicrobium sp. B8]MBW0144164.1 DUF1428 domain-containing protein [Sphingomicrobium sp. B8]